MRGQKKYKVYLRKVTTIEYCKDEYEFDFEYDIIGKGISWSWINKLIKDKIVKLQ